LFHGCSGGFRKEGYASVTTKSGELVYRAIHRASNSDGAFPQQLPRESFVVDMPRYLGRQKVNFDLMSFDLDTDLALVLKSER
jgi:hypothetical protein